jgi:hypothetical protein
MAVNAEAVIAGRNYKVFRADYALSNVMPADTVAWGAVASPYSEMGYTSGGLQFQMGLQRGEIRVDQEFDPLVRPVQSRNLQLTANLAEMNPANLKAATGMGTISSVAPASGTRGHDDLVLGSGLTEQYGTYLFDILQPDNEAFRILGYRCIATGSPSPSFTPDQAAVTQLQVSPLPDTNTTPTRIMLIRDVLPAAA